MDPQQLLKTSKFYSNRKKCDTEKTLVGVGTNPLGSPKVNQGTNARRCPMPFSLFYSIFVFLKQRGIVLVLMRHTILFCIEYTYCVLSIEYTYVGLILLQLTEQQILSVGILEHSQFELVVGLLLFAQHCQ